MVYGIYIFAVYYRSDFLDYVACFSIFEKTFDLNLSFEFIFSFFYSGNGNWWCCIYGNGEYKKHYNLSQDINYSSKNKKQYIEYWIKNIWFFEENILNNFEINELFIKKVNINNNYIYRRKTRRTNALRQPYKHL